MVGLRVLILVLDSGGLVEKTARAIAEGVQAAGEKPVYVTDAAAAQVKPRDFDLIFFGFQPSGFLKQTAGKLVLKTIQENDWKNVKTGVFSVCTSDSGKTAASEVTDALATRGARILNALSLKINKSIIGGESGLSETDLVRAHGFGERTTNNAKQVVVRKESEKKRIRGYG